MKARAPSRGDGYTGYIALLRLALWQSRNCRSFVARNMRISVTDKTDRRAFVRFVSSFGGHIFRKHGLKPLQI